MVPVLVPEDPPVMEAQLPVLTTEAVQAMLPVPVLVTVKVVVPEVLVTLREAGVTERTGAVVVKLTSFP
jgi:hypothetical protein